MYSYETAALLLTVCVCVWAEGLHKVIQSAKIMSKLCHFESNL